MQPSDKMECEHLEKLFPFQSRYIKLDGHNLHYIDEGAGPVILLLHACPMWSFEFRKLIMELRDDHRVIAFDQMGFGFSDKPLDFDYRIEAHSDHLGRFIKALGVSEFTLLGHGRGTTIGMAYAVRHPDNIKGIVTLNAMTFSDYSLPWRLMLCRLSWNLGANIAMRLNIFQRDTNRLPEDIRLCYEYPFRESEKRIALIRFIEDLPCSPEDDSAMTMFEIESALWLLREKPVCIIWAKKDWLYTMKCLKRWQQYFPEAETHIIDHAGHCITEDAESELSFLIPDFLKRHNL